MEAGSIHRSSDLCCISRRFEAQLLERATGELDAVIHALDGERADTYRYERNGESDGDAPPADEIEFGVVEDSQHLDAQCLLIGVAS